MNIHTKYENSAIKELEAYVNEYMRSEAGHQRQIQKGDVKEHSLWLAANIPAKRQLLENALIEMNDWYPHHALKDLLVAALN